MSARFSHSHGRRRRGIAVVQFAVMIPAVFGCAVLVVDVGMLYKTRADLQSAADAAALAGASAYFTNTGLVQDEYVLTKLIRDRAQQFSELNPTLGQSTTLEVADIAIGTHDFDKPSEPMTGGGRLNAVEVTVRRTPESSNGPVPFLFAAVFGKSHGSVTATARAAMNDRVVGYRPPDGGLLPFTIHEDIYHDRFENGPDEFSYDNGVLTVSDGVPEVDLFPWKWKDVNEEVDSTDGTDGAGNFGTLSIGLASQGTSYLDQQIRNGITAAEIEDEFGTPELTFHDEVEGPQTYLAPGNTGVSVSLGDALSTRVGQVVGFFVHKGMQKTGANTQYILSGVRFGRVVEVKLSGGPTTRRLVLQPVAYEDANVRTGTTGPSTEGHVGRAVLVR